MKKSILVGGICLVLAGCGNGSGSAAEPAASVSTEFSQDDYAAYLDLYGHQEQRHSWTAGVNCHYRRIYNNESTEDFDMDGVLAVQNIQNDPSAHYSQHINSNGMQFELSGDYYHGILYNNYNGVAYYEEHTWNQLKDIMLVYMDPFSIAESDVLSLQREGDTFTFVLDDSSAETIFLDVYDFSGLSDYPDLEVKQGIIVQSFDENGFLSETKASFDVSLTVQNIPVQVEYSSSVGFLRINETEVVISDETRAEQSAYVSVMEINTDEISDADLEADRMEASAAETFRKRLVYRLKYEIQEDGTYKSSFNDHETYTVDFTNHQFIYTNYVSKYVYNWQGDTGFFGNYCNFDFKTGASSESCQDSAVEMIQNVKMYFQMELYYCGLSLDDLKEG